MPQTLDVLDGAGTARTISLPLAAADNGRAAAAGSRPVALSTEDKAALDAVGTKLDTLNGLVGGTDSQLPAALVGGKLSVTGLSDAELRATPVPVSGTVTATGPLTDAQLRATAVPVSGTVAVTGVATEASLAIARDELISIDAKLPAQGQAAMAASMPVVLASNQSAINVVEPATTITGQSAQTATVNNILPATAGASGTDVTNFRAASVQVVSTGTAGTFIFEQSNDGTNWQALPVFNSALTTGVPITAAITASASQIIYTVPLRATQLRLRIATTITGGSIQAFTRLSTEPWTPTVTSVAQPTAASLAVTASIAATQTLSTVTTVSTVSNVAAIAAGANAIGDVGIQYRANATGAASVINVLSPATPAVQTVKAAAGRLLSLTLTNTNAAARFLKVWNTASGSITLGTTAALLEIGIPANQTIQLNLDGGIGFSTAINIAVTAGQGLTNNAAVTLGDVTGFVTFA